jgi:NAD(P)-dependent dehydrogenase (short-subunit alcohol dehydrogenase family)
MSQRTQTQETKYILVTGANRGIGRATVAAILDADPETHVFLGSRSVERGEEARAEVLSERSEAKDRVEVVQIDVADDASVEQAAKTVAAKLGDAPLYGVVNNAGIGDRKHPMQTVLDVNVRGPHRVCETFLARLSHPGARIVNVASASGPNFVDECSPQRQRLLTDPEVTWEQIEEFMEEAVAIDDSDGDFESAGLGSGSAYGLSKACLNAYTIALARENFELTINACTPGFIETDMTRAMAERKGVDPAELGMKPPEEGTIAQMFLLFGEPDGSGWYFGSDAKRSPLDRYRSPGDPPYTGE